MRNSTVIKDEGMRALAERLGPVDAERFITLLRREPFDYTEWRQSLYKDMPLDDFLKKADEYRRMAEEKIEG